MDWARIGMLLISASGPVLLGLGIWLALLRHWPWYLAYAPVICWLVVIVILIAAIVWAFCQMDIG